MKRLFVLSLATLALLAGTGCAHVWFFGKKKAPVAAAPKQSPYISTDVEMNFRQRWVDKRANELLSQGMIAEDARAKALAEFRAEFSYIKAAQVP